MASYASHPIPAGKEEAGRRGAGQSSQCKNRKRSLAPVGGAGPCPRDAAADAAVLRERAGPADAGAMAGGKRAKRLRCSRRAGRAASPSPVRSDKSHKLAAENSAF